MERDDDPGWLTILVWLAALLGSWLLLVGLVAAVVVAYSEGAFG